MKAISISLGMFLYWKMATYAGEEWVVGYRHLLNFNPGGEIEKLRTAKSLLNVPANKQGRIDDAAVQVLEEAGRTLKQEM